VKVSTGIGDEIRKMVEQYLYVMQETNNKELFVCPILNMG